MQAFSPPPYRINIKRGRKLPETSGAADFLRSNEQISPLLPTIRRNAKLQKDCGNLLPAMFEACDVLQLEEGQLTLSAPNAALATKLKQQCPKLQDGLLQRGWQINAIRIKVQVRRKVEPKPYVKQCSLSDRAVKAFDNLENALENTPQNADLRAALHKLVKRHQSGT
ncbi:DciA family protein [Undibacterium sp. Xuan67W]|uniref:DciA family protein n=1 Tax=Undibacterium sp. Xuan67W TaxID=3413057 RepID=UPI003BF3878E